MNCHFKKIFFSKRLFPKRFFFKNNMYHFKCVKQFLSYSAKIRKIIVKNAPVSVLFQRMIWLDPWNILSENTIYIYILDHLVLMCTPAKCLLKYDLNKFQNWSLKQTRPDSAVCVLCEPHSSWNRGSARWVG